MKRNKIVVVIAIIFSFCAGLILFDTYGNKKLVISPTNKQTEKLNTDFFFHCYSFGLDKYTANSLIYKSGELHDTEIDTFNGYYNSVSKTALAPIYEYYNINDYEKLTDLLGQFYFYHNYEDVEIFVFYNTYKEQPYEQNIILINNGNIHIIKDIHTKSETYFPLLTYREKNYFYILSPKEGASNNISYELKKIDLSTFDYNNLYFSITDIPNDFNQIDIVVINEQLVYGIREFQTTIDEQGFASIKEKPDTLYTFDTNTRDLKRHELTHEKLDNFSFLLRDEINLVFGDVIIEEPNNCYLLIQTVSIEDTISTQHKVDLQSASATIKQHTFYKDNYLYLDMTLEDQDAIVMIDLKSNQVANVYKYKLDNKYSGLRTKYVYSKNDEIYNHLYSSCR